MRLDRRVGDCVAMEKHAHAATTKSQGELWLRTYYAEALGARHASRELVLETLQSYWSSLPPERAFEAIHDRTLIAILYGDFIGARELLEGLAHAVEPRVELDAHVRYGLTRLELLAETNDTKGAARFADELSRRMGAWTRPPGASIYAWGIRFFEPRLVAARTDLSPLERAQALDEWRAWAKSSDTDANAIWAFGEALPAESATAIENALRTMPPMPKIPSTYAAVDAFTGRVLVRGGRAADAIAPLRAASARCDATEQPFENTRAHLWLGQALEATGDDHGACEAYAVVVRRWCEAKPVSVSATTARERMTKLGCGN
jgi:hypothetical protein